MGISYDFDRIIDRYPGYSTKWHKYPARDILPLWVADMDFAAPEVVQEALAASVAHGVYGYSCLQHQVRNDVVNYMRQEYDWYIRKQDIIWLPGLVSGINLACRALTRPGEDIVTATPIYPPFLKAPTLAERGLIVSPLINKANKWEWDWIQLEEQLAIAGPRARLLLLCNPHNPVGRVWTRAELERLLELVVRYNLLVCSDEIHCDLILDETTRHIPFASLNSEAAKRTLTLMAPSKTYNLAGLNCAYAITSSRELREQITKITSGLLGDVNSFGLTACQAALTQAGPWRQQLLAYLRANAELAIREISKIPGLTVTVPQPTYLLWIDGRELCKRYQITNLQRFFEQAGVGLSDGNDFAGPGFIRLNFGTPRAILSQALARMQAAVASCK